MIKIGITGGIGSGKTVVSTLLELMDIPVYIADEESKVLTKNSPVIREKLIHLLGESIYTPEGLNKKLLASYIFNNPDCLQQVNAIIHPVVNQHFLEWTNQLTTGVCAIESAILFESGFDKIVDISLMIYAPMELRIERAMKRGSVTREEITKRIQSQLSDDIKKEKADYIIRNNDKQALIPQLQNFINRLTFND